MRNIVLLQPKLGDMDQFRDRPTPPMGLICAVSDIAEEFEVRLVDQRMEPEWKARLGSAVDSNTVAAGVTTLTGKMIRNALEMAAEARRHRNIPIVWGGIHPSLLPEQTVRHELVDYVVEGEGERAFGNLVRELAASRVGDAIPGVWYGRNGKVVGNRRSGVLEMDSLPPVPYHLVDLERYIGQYRGKRMFFYQSSRGCPFRCTYCYNNVFNLRRWRCLKEERVLDELGRLRRRYDFSSVYFLDDDFFIDLPRAMRILAGLRDLGVSSVLQGVSVQTLSKLGDADLDFLEQAGVERISIGVESGVDRIRLKLLEKWGNVELVKQQLGRLRGRGILVLCTFIVGFPTEKWDEILKTIDLALWTLKAGENFRVPQLYNYTPYPGTDLFRSVEQQGHQFPGQLDEWARYEWDNNTMFQEDVNLRNRLERLVFLSKFLDRKVEDYGFGGSLLRLAYRVYRPVARFRMRTGLVSPLPERALYGILKDHLGQ